MPPDLEVAKGIKNRILAATDDSVQRILLHGSRVSGHAHPNSDCDVLVVMRDPVHDCVGEALRLSELFVDFPQPVDIQVWGEEEFEECRAVPATVAYPADRYGVVLYGHARGSSDARRPELDRVRPGRPAWAEMGAGAENLRGLAQIGFHAQQAVEKLLKAVLAAHDVVPEEHHDIARRSPRCGCSTVPRSMRSPAL